MRSFGYHVFRLRWAKAHRVNFYCDPLLAQHVALALRIMSAGLIFSAYGMVLRQMFNGAGDTRQSS